MWHSEQLRRIPHASGVSAELETDRCLQVASPGSAGVAQTDTGSVQSPLWVYAETEFQIKIKWKVMEESSLTIQHTLT